MKLKRRSRPDIDLAEDGGRAIAIEEAVSALVFAYASEHNYLEGKGPCRQHPAGDHPLHHRPA
jgi:hypothetical protein